MKKEATAEAAKKPFDWAKWGKITRWLITASIMVPFCAVMSVAMTRQVQAVYEQIKASEGAVDGGEFDPRMGEKITTKNHRALVVVHQGFGQELYQAKYKSDQEYQDYLRRLQAEIALYYANGDPVVEVVTDYDLAKGMKVLRPKPNTLYYVTQSNNGFGVKSFVNDGVSYYQATNDLDKILAVQTTGTVWDILREAGVDEVEMTGEMRGACPNQVATGIESSGIKVGWCDMCAFPTIDTIKNPEAYPTLQPLP